MGSERFGLDLCRMMVNEIARKMQTICGPNIIFRIAVQQTKEWATIGLTTSDNITQNSEDRIARVATVCVRREKRHKRRLNCGVRSWPA